MLDIITFFNSFDFIAGAIFIVTFYIATTFPATVLHGLTDYERGERCPCGGLTYAYGTTAFLCSKTRGLVSECEKKATVAQTARPR